MTKIEFNSIYIYIYDFGGNNGLLKIDGWM